MRLCATSPCPARLTYNFDQLRRLALRGRGDARSWAVTASSYPLATHYIHHERLSRREAASTSPRCAFQRLDDSCRGPSDRQLRDRPALLLRQWSGTSSRFLILTERVELDSQKSSARDLSLKAPEWIGTSFLIASAAFVPWRARRPSHLVGRDYTAQDRWTCEDLLAAGHLPRFAGLLNDRLNHQRGRQIRSRPVARSGSAGHRQGRRRSAWCA